MGFKYLLRNIINFMIVIFKKMNFEHIILHLRNIYFVSNLLYYGIYNICIHFNLLWNI